MYPPPLLPLTRDMYPPPLLPLTRDMYPPPLLPLTRDMYPPPLLPLLPASMTLSAGIHIALNAAINAAPQAAFAKVHYTATPASGAGGSCFYSWSVVSTPFSSTN